MRVSVNDVLASELPQDATGVHWEDTGWTECVEHLTHESWTSAVERSDEKTGVVLTGEVECDWDKEQG